MKLNDKNPQRANPLQFQHKKGREKLGRKLTKREWKVGFGGKWIWVWRKREEEDDNNRRQGEDIGKYQLSDELTFSFRTKQCKYKPTFVIPWRHCQLPTVAFSRVVISFLQAQSQKSLFFQAQGLPGPYVSYQTYHWQMFQTCSPLKETNLYSMASNETRPKHGKRAMR